MARQVSGNWRRSTVGYTGARVWGTGINPVHSQYGEGPPVRVTGRDESVHTAPGEAVPDVLTQRQAWGYTCDDSPYVGVDYDHRPSVGVSTQDFRNTSNGYPVVDASGTVKEQFRATMGGAHSYDQEIVKVIPSETVTEGWRNKPQGSPANSKPSDPSQYEIRTSMVQRYRDRNNDHAVSRGTDHPRFAISSRVTGQKLKFFSGEERHYDMFPFQQEEIHRPFWYRTAGTGWPWQMRANELDQRVPIQRTPPSDPALGAQETSLATTDYGYTGEDGFYA